MFRNLYIFLLFLKSYFKYLVYVLLFTEIYLVLSRQRYNLTTMLGWYMWTIAFTYEIFSHSYVCLLTITQTLQGTVQALFETN